MMMKSFLILQHLVFLFSSKRDPSFFEIYNIRLISSENDKCCKEEVTLVNSERNYLGFYKILKWICYKKVSEMKTILNRNNKNEIVKLLSHLIKEIAHKSKLFDYDTVEEIKKLTKDKNSLILKNWYIRLLSIYKLSKVNSFRKNTNYNFLKSNEHKPLGYFPVSSVDNILYYTIPGKLLNFLEQNFLIIDSETYKKVKEEIGLIENDDYGRQGYQISFNNSRYFKDSIPTIKEYIKPDTINDYKGTKLIISIRFYDIFLYVTNCKCSNLKNSKCEICNKLNLLLIQQRKKIKKTISDIFKSCNVDYTPCLDLEIDILPEYISLIHYCCSSRIFTEDDFNKYGQNVVSIKNILLNQIEYFKKVKICNNKLIKAPEISNYQQKLLTLEKNKKKCSAETQELSKNECNNIISESNYKNDIENCKINNFSASKDMEDIVCSYNNYITRLCDKIKNSKNEITIKRINSQENYRQDSPTSSKIHDESYNPGLYAKNLIKHANKSENVNRGTGNDTINVNYESGLINEIENISIKRNCKNKKRAENNGKSDDNIDFFQNKIKKEAIHDNTLSSPLKIDNGINKPGITRDSVDETVSKTYYRSLARGLDLRSNRKKIAKENRKKTKKNNKAFSKYFLCSFLSYKYILSLQEISFYSNFLKINPNFYDNL